MNPYRVSDLEGMSCSAPGCTHEAHDGLYFHGRCHPSSPTFSMYQAGVMSIECATCKKVIARIQVAS